MEHLHHDVAACSKKIKTERERKRERGRKRKESEREREREEVVVMVDEEAELSRLSSEFGSMKKPRVSVLSHLRGILRRRTAAGW